MIGEVIGKLISESKTPRFAKSSLQTKKIIRKSIFFLSKYLQSIKNNTTFAVSNGFDMKKKSVRQVIKMLEEDGWEYSYTNGSHRQFKHPKKSGKVTVNGKLSDDVGGFLLVSILKQAGLK